jgi:hypothetical protein
VPPVHLLRSLSHLYDTTLMMYISLRRWNIPESRHDASF